MTTIHYKLLAGNHYQERDRVFGIGPRTVYNVKNTFSIPSVWHSFDGFKGPKQNRNAKVDIESGKTGADGKVKTILTYREPFHSFKYYEALGSFYGIHELINEREAFESSWAEIRDEWKSEPIYIDRLDRLRTDKPIRYNNSSNDICTFSLLLKFENGEVTHPFNSSIKYDEYDNPYIEFHIGEFHLLPNTPRHIYRCNLSSDLLYIPEGIDHFRSNRNIKSRVLDIVQPTFTSDSPIEFYLGFTKLVDSGKRPNDFNTKDLEARHPEYIEGGAQIRWKSLSDKCLTWTRIYDGLDLKDILSSESIAPGHYVLNSKAIIRLNKLSSYIKSLNPDELSNFKLLIHPPSYSILPYDEVSELSEPRVAMFVSDVSQIKFDVPRNYKTSGSFHFKLNIYDNDRETLIVSDSSYPGIGFQKNPNIDIDLKRGKWTIKIGEDLLEFGEKGIRFDSAYNNNSGTEVELYGEVTYSLSESLSKYLKDKERFYVSVETIDGTRQNNG